MTEPVVESAASAAGHWSIQARDGVYVETSWLVSSDGNAVCGVVRDRDSGLSFDFSLALPDRQRITGALQSIDITLTLYPDNKEVVLGCNLPISRNQFFNAPIGKWPQGGAKS